jgi:hypothetical protein
VHDHALWDARTLCNFVGSVDCIIWSRLTVGVSFLGQVDCSERDVLPSFPLFLFFLVLLLLSLLFFSPVLYLPSYFDTFSSPYSVTNSSTGSLRNSWVLCGRAATLLTDRKGKRLEAASRAGLRSLPYGVKTKTSAPSPPCPSACAVLTPYGLWELSRTGQAGTRCGLGRRLEGTTVGLFAVGERRTCGDRLAAPAGRGHLFRPTSLLFHLSL